MISLQLEVVHLSVAVVTHSVRCLVTQTENTLVLRTGLTNVFGTPLAVKPTDALVLCLTEEAIIYLFTFLFYFVNVECLG
jgi:hypothetical protein